MAIKKGDKYICSYCEKEFVHPQEADSCRDSHELILVTLTKTDLNHIIQFIYTRDSELIDEKLVKRLKKFARQKAS